MNEKGKKDSSISVTFAILTMLEALQIKGQCEAESKSLKKKKEDT